MPCILWRDGYMLPTLNPQRETTPMPIEVVSQERQDVAPVSLHTLYITDPSGDGPSVARPDKRYFTQPGLTARTSSKGSGHGEEPAPLHPTAVRASRGGVGGARTAPPNVRNEHPSMTRGRNG